MSTSDYLSIDKNKIAALVDMVEKERPLPYREYDQIYMINKDLVGHISLLNQKVAGKDVVFMGDGDGVSILLALVTKGTEYEPHSITVFDFDNRILNTYRRLSQEYDISNFKCYQYNIIDPLPADCLRKYDFYHINPPYGSKNNGLSCILWLMRCLDACKLESCSGCVVYPYDENHNWSIVNMKRIVNFLRKNGFEVDECWRNIHKYHLQDNPTLRSSSLFVRSVSGTSRLEWNTQIFDCDEIETLYGRKRPLPHYIEDNGSEYGIVNLNWNGDLDGHIM